MTLIPWKKQPMRLISHCHLIFFIYSWMCNIPNKINIFFSICINFQRILFLRHFHKIFLIRIFSFTMFLFQITQILIWNSWIKLKNIQKHWKHTEERKNMLNCSNVWSLFSINIIIDVSNQFMLRIILDSPSERSK